MLMVAGTLQSYHGSVSPGEAKFRVISSLFQVKTKKQQTEIELVGLVGRSICENSLTKKDWQIG
jgi:hypothetical protein